MVSQFSLIHMVADLLLASSTYKHWGESYQHLDQKIFPLVKVHVIWMEEFMSDLVQWVTYW